MLLDPVTTLDPSVTGKGPGHRAAGCGQSCYGEIQNVCVGKIQLRQPHIIHDELRGKMRKEETGTSVHFRPRGKVHASRRNSGFGIRGLGFKS
jgi:hypothetical protein